MVRKRGLFQVARNGAGRGLGVVLLLVFAVFGACSYVVDGEGSEQAKLQVSVLDVGQGLAVLFEMEGRFGMYDTGPDSAGIVDTLRARGIDALEWVLVSHGHRDHGGGLWEMAESGIHVGRMMVGPDAGGDFVADSLEAVARRFRIPVDTLVRGDTVLMGGGFLAEVLWPSVYEKFEGNAASVVLQVSTGASGGSMISGAASNGASGASGLAAQISGPAGSFILTGDLDSTSERKLLELSPTLSADLLQVGHHGSAGSSSLKFLSQVQPDFAVISVGAGNSYGHPKEEVLRKLKYVVKDSTRVLRTDLDGTISFELVPELGLMMPQELESREH